VLIEQREEMQLRLEQCVDAIYALRPKAVDNNIDKVIASLNKHQGEFKLFYMNATLKVDNTEHITKLIASIFDIDKEQIEGEYHIEIAIALSIVCDECHEVHYHSLVPLKATFNNEETAYELVGALHSILNG